VVPEGKNNIAETMPSSFEVKRATGVRKEAYTTDTRSSLEGLKEG
jgi:hypothetical protein